VCALNKIVVMKFIEESIMRPSYLDQSILTGDNHSGFVLLPGDFMNGRLSDVKLTDMVIQDEHNYEHGPIKNIGSPPHID